MNDEERALRRVTELARDNTDLRRERDAARAEVERLRAALSGAYFDARVLAHAYHVDGRPPQEIVDRCLARLVNIGEEVDTVVASPALPSSQVSPEATEEEAEHGPG